MKRIELYKLRVAVLTILSGALSCSLLAVGADCGGTRFRPETLLYRLGGKTIAEVYALDVAAALRFFRALSHPDGNPVDLFAPLG